MYTLGYYGRDGAMRKKRTVYLRNIYQDFLNKKREETGQVHVFSKGDFRRIKRHWNKFKVILP